MASSSNRNRNGDDVFSGSQPHRAIIDIGSNTVRMVVYGGSKRAPSVLLNEKVVAQLGRQVSIDGTMSAEAMDTAYGALARYSLMLRDLGIDKIDAVATAAMRDASNGPDLMERIRGLGMEPRILSGSEEAEVSAMGVIGAFPGAAGVVADLGGGSLEMVRIADGKISDPTTMPLGTLRLAKLRENSDGSFKKAIIGKLKDGGWAKPVDAPLYLVGGTFRSMAVLAMEAAGSPLTDPHGLSIDTEAATKLLDRLVKADPAALASNPRISSMRSEKLPDAAVLLQAMLKKMRPERIIFSSWGLREGMLYSRLGATQRLQDPLLAGVANFGSTRGAPPMLAARVAGWTVAAVPSKGQGSERLRLAATTLALASMQIEPNLRLRQGIEWALHKRWLAIEPRERAMLAATIAANGNHCELDDELRAIASKSDLEEAICWGLAVRLCRRLGASSRKSLQASALRLEDGVLTLKIEESYRELFGTPSEKDLKLLGERLGVDYTMKVVPDGASNSDVADQGMAVPA